MYRARRHDPLADRLLAGKHAAGERLVDDHDRLGVGAIVVCEEPPAETASR